MNNNSLTTILVVGSLPTVNPPDMSSIMVPPSEIYDAPSEKPYLALPSGLSLTENVASLCRDAYLLGVLVHAEESSELTDQEHAAYLAHARLARAMQADAVEELNAKGIREYEAYTIARMFVGGNSYSSPSQFLGSQQVAAVLQIGYLTHLIEQLRTQGYTDDDAWAMIALIPHPVRHGANAFYAEEPLRCPYPRPE
jgi:hypothetical protein